MQFCQIPCRVVDGETNDTAIAVRNANSAGTGIEVISRRILANWASAPDTRAGVLHVGQGPICGDRLDGNVLDVAVYSVEEFSRTIDGQRNGIGNAGLAIYGNVGATVIGPGRAGNVGESSVSAGYGEA